MTTISMKQAVDAIVAFMAREAQKVNPLTDRFLAYAALGAAKANPDAVLARFRPALEMAGVVSAEGTICLEAVQGAFELAFENVPTVTMAGFTFTRADADALMRQLLK